MAITWILIEIAKLNCVGLQAWLTWVLVQIEDFKITRQNAVMPWCQPADVAEQGSPLLCRSTFTGRSKQT
jgi:hypothetical protein